MSESKHTPGPWEWEILDYGGHPDRQLIKRSGEHFSLAHPLSDTRSSCIFCSAPYGTQGDAHLPTKADMALIAAAPELLEALKEHGPKNCSCKLQTIAGFPVPCATCRCKKIIAKAEGRDA